MALTDRDVIRPGAKLHIRTGSVSKLMKQAIKTSLPLVGDIFLVAALKNTGLQDHTLEELRQMGNPYAASLPEDSGPHPDALVHRQSGKLQESLRVSTVMETSRTFAVYIVSNSPYIQALLHGTPTMRPRPFIEKTYRDVKKKMWKPITDNLRKIKYRIAQK